MKAFITAKCVVVSEKGLIDNEDFYICINIRICKNKITPYKIIFNDKKRSWKCNLCAPQ